MKRIIALLAIISLFLTSCSQKWCKAHYPEKASKDSIYIETVTEKPVYIPGDSVFIEAPVINCPDQSLIKFENTKLKQEISIIKGKLTSNTIIKPDTVYVPVKETITEIREVKVPDPVRYTPKFYKYCTGGFILIILAFLIWTFIKYKVKILSLIK